MSSESNISSDSSLSIIDTHCHLDMKEFDPDRKEVIERARAAGIEAMITVGSDLKGTVSAMNLSSQYDFIYASIGIHPHDAKFSMTIYTKAPEWAKGTGSCYW
jgi:TatD DNase family protein